MTSYFVPYIGENPATVEVNGHKMVLVSSELEAVDSILDVSGADDYRQVSLTDDDLIFDEESLRELGSATAGGIVITPPGLSAEEVLVELEHQLPWVH